MLPPVFVRSSEPDIVPSDAVPVSLELFMPLLADIDPLPGSVPESADTYQLWLEHMRGHFHVPASKDPGKKPSP